MNERKKSVRFWTSDEFLTPLYIEKNGSITPVFIQQRWQTGEFAEFIVKNGCGHACTAMALRLSGFSELTPYDVYVRCRELFGAPRTEEPYLEGNWLSLAGIRKVLDSFGVKTQTVFIEEGGEERAAEEIFEFLRGGRTVIFNSVPRGADNPFSTGSHYVLAVGLTDDGEALVANSSLRGKTSPLGIQTASKEVIASAIVGGEIHKDGTWGTHHLYEEYGFCVI